MKTLLLTFLLEAAALAQPLWRPYYISPRAEDPRVDLSGDWQLAWRDAPAADLAALDSVKDWINAAGPGSIHMALHRAGKLPHPYYNLNSHQYRWLADKVWYYRKSFQAPAAAGRYAFLCFDGISYYARVWLNGKYLGEHEGMFGGPNVEVGELLRTGSNDVVVEVRAANWGRAAQYKKDARTGPAIQPWIFTGGSGAEDFFVLGMWRGARIEFPPRTHLERPFLVTESASPTEARLRLTAEVFAGAHSNQYELHPTDRSILGRFQNSATVKKAAGSLSVRLTLREPGAARPAFTQSSPVEAFEGRNWIRQRYVVPRPRLWWPNGMGEPFLYEAEVALLDGGNVVDKLSFDFGIRTLRTVETPTRRTLDMWGDWQFVVNGRKFFVKGINWMPADLLLDLTPARYAWLLDMARNAGFQMLRVWGGGLVETDEFYRQANRRGLLVWQDFPLSNTIASEWPLDVWEAQAAQNVFRLRNHPSLALWCGGNESNAYATGNAGPVGIFERTAIELDGTRPWRRTSPDVGGLHQYPDMDPTWYGKMYRYVPFMAETGMHNIPEARSMREVVDASEFEKPLSNMYSQEFADNHPDFRHHFAEFNPSRVPRMLSRASHIGDMSAPTIEALSEASQMGAAEFYQILSEQLQANYPHTAGLLPWVFKRPWPVVAIMLADGFGHPTAPYYFLKRTYEPVHVSIQLPEILWAPGESVPIDVKVTNANPAGQSGLTVTVEAFDTSFASLWKRTAPLAVKPGPSVNEAKLGAFPIPAALRDQFFFLVAEARDGQGALLSRSCYWPRSLARLEDAAFRDKYRGSPQPHLTFDKGPWLKPAVAATRTSLELAVTAAPVQDSRQTVTLRVRNTGKVPAFPVFLDIEGAKRAFFGDDNFFWLAPGERRTIRASILWREPGEGKTITYSASAWNAGRAEARR